MTADLQKIERDNYNPARDIFSESNDLEQFRKKGSLARIAWLIDRIRELKQSELKRAL